MEYLLGKIKIKMVFETTICCFSLQKLRRGLVDVLR
jgi:hypothetical protein